MSKTEKGVVIGAGAGAVVGGAVGKVIGETAKGAIVGAVVGGAAGAIIGGQMDKQAKELENEIEGAEITRVGEGIVVTFDSGLLFDFDSAELQPAARANLTELSESVREYDNTDLMIVGHTDDIGSDSYNDALSVRRAESAGAYLFEQGVNPSRVTTTGKGETDPIATNDTDEGRQLNRRVEVVIFASEEYRESLQATEG